ncbi:SAM-dependent methyltransferase [Streptomyces nanshensis]|uniref:SAM-dependent methyltransferase n=1 Tax=Streptomyces nanshensis TaxID=518642 RepID=UPI003B84B59E
MTDHQPPKGVDDTVPHSARVYDYFLGGRDHYQVDIEAAHRLKAIWPGLPTGMEVNRSFVHRVARWAVTEGGVRQFIDIGTGLPTSPNLHEVAQQADPSARVLYVDNDPLVLVHAQAVLTSSAQDQIAYILADARDPDAILQHPDLGNTLDLTEPVCLCIIGMLHFIHDDAHDVVRRLLEPLPAGSLLVTTIVTADFDPDRLTRIAEEYTNLGMPMLVRNKDEVTAFFEDMDLVDPGVVPAHRWKPIAGAPPVADDEVAVYAAVGRKR